jgi:hypothetical protein
MWPSSPKRTPEELRREIENDPDLGAKQKNQLLARLDEKLGGSVAPYDPPQIARRNQGLFQTIRSTTVAKIQNRRLEEHNKTLELATQTINNLTTARKAWDRLQSVDDEIARDRAREEASFGEDMTAAAARLRGQERTLRQTEQGMELDSARHELELDSARHELELERIAAQRETLRRGNIPKLTGPAKTMDQQKQDLRDKYELAIFEANLKAQAEGEGQRDRTPSYYGKDEPTGLELDILQSNESDERKVIMLMKLDREHQRDRDEEVLRDLIAKYHRNRNS